MLVIAMSIAVAATTWCCVHNTLFDMAEQRFSGRLASDRPQAWRLVHAVSNEFTSVLVTLPIIMWLGGYGFWAALAVDLGFTVFYAAYAYVFHMAYDRLRPMRPVLTVMSQAANDDTSGGAAAAQYGDDKAAARIRAMIAAAPQIMMSSLMSLPAWVAR